MQNFKLFLTVFAVVSIFSSFNKTPDAEAVNWISFDELAKQYKTNPKPILVDIYTNWCGWCKKMDRDTYSNGNVAKYINEKFYAVKFNAESQTDVPFNGKIYKYDSKSRVNTLAVYFTNGRLSYPQTVLLTSSDATPSSIAGYLKASDIETPLKFIGEKIYEKKNYAQFKSDIKSEW